MPAENDPQSTPTPNLPSIGGEYRLISKLGEGAFGEVYKCHHDLLGQDFAVKLLRPELCEDKDIRDRFLDEARALIRFSHPNIVQVRHVGEHNGRLFLVMDLVSGTELSDQMKKGPMEEQQALAIMKQVLSGLEAAHAAGIVHRDLKPSNILIEKHADGRDVVKILDFGLSKFSAVDGVKGAHRSITGTIVGTLAYMSPEQIKGERDIDGRSDLFAVGIIFMEMLQGHHPYPGESGIVVAAKLLRDPIPPIDAKRARSISDVTRGALARALERDRDARFASVTAFSQALEGRGPPSDTSRVTTVLEAQAELARREAAAKRAKSPAGKARTKASQETLVLPPEKKKRSAIPLVAAIVLIGGAAAAYFVLTGKENAPPENGGTRAADVGDPASMRPTTTPTPTPSRPQRPGPDRPPVVPPVDPAPVDQPPVDQPPIRPPPVDPVPPRVDPVPPPVDPVAPPAGTDPASTPPTDPQTPPPAVPGPDVPTPPPSGVAPEDCCAQALELAAAGDWSGARTLYKQAVAGSEVTSPTQVSALRGAAESYITEADALARSARVPEALALLREAVQWLDERHNVYESVKNAVEVARLQLGFSRMHLAEAHAESARWLMLQGDGQAADVELKAAESNYDFARQQLERDGVRFWEFLIRRAEFHRLRGDSEKMIADVAHTTMTNNNEVPAHMWVAHATAARRLAQAHAGNGNAAQGLEWARKAMKVAEDGASWQEDKLTRQQWLDLARVLFVYATMQPATEDPTAVHGKLRYWVEMAGKQAPSASLHRDAAEAGLTTGRAMERLLHGMVLRHRQQADEAVAAFEEAATLTSEAIALRKAVAAEGGLLEDRLAYEVQAAVMTALGRSDATQAAVAAARTVERANPD